MNALLYSLVVVIWGTTWIAIFLQQGPVAAPVSIFWRFALATTVMMLVLPVVGAVRAITADGARGGRPLSRAAAGRAALSPGSGSRGRH